MLCWIAMKLQQKQERVRGGGGKERVTLNSCCSDSRISTVTAAANAYKINTVELPAISPTLMVSVKY